MRHDDTPSPAPSSASQDSQDSQASAANGEARWQPIETAPEDGTAVLIWQSPWRDGSEAHYIPGHGWYLANIDHTDNHGRAFYPTHWMPLPMPPSPKEQRT